MRKLLFDFVVQLQDHDLPYPLNHNGPLFHKWLPDGEKDAILLNTSEPLAELKVSFQRRGFIDDSGYARFNWDRNEVDPTVIARQAVLEGGFMVGWLSIEVSDEELEKLHDSASGDLLLEGLGKRVIKLIYPPVTKLIKILQTNYGQYWLREPSKWDSRSQSLGSYCAGLGFRWSLDEGKNWLDFVPTERLSRSEATVVMASNETFKRELLTQDEWVALSDIVHSDYEPSLAASLVSRAYKFYDQGDLRQAFIEGITALEVALYRYIKEKRGVNPTVASHVEKFENSTLGLGAKVATAATLCGNVSPNDIEAAIAAYEIRNKIAHEGAEPFDDDEEKLMGLLRTAAAFVAGPVFRFPTSHRQNALDSPNR